jgi:hypothetical protein
MPTGLRSNESRGLIEHQMPWDEPLENEALRLSTLDM